MKRSTQPWDEQDAAAYQRFLGAARGYWSTRMFDSLRRQIAHDVPRDGSACATDAEWAAEVRTHTTHRVFAFLERHLQRMRYSGQYGLVAAVEQQRDALLAALAKPLPEGLLRLDPELPLPQYYRDCDIHQHPGGVAGDALGGVVYRTAAGAGVVGKPQLHDRFAQLATAGRAAARVLDLGCGYGKSTWAFARALPSAHVDGVDLSPSCVTVAAQDTPEDLRPRVAFAQADAMASGLPDASYDLVTSTMLLHEMPEDAVRGLIAESARLTKPGGAVVHLDFLPPADPLLVVLFEGHARRNNEPYLLDHSRIDLRDAYTRAGFRRVEAVAFAEEDGALDPALPRWRLPWTMIVAER